MNVPGLEKRSNNLISLMIFFSKKYQNQKNCLYLCAFGSLAGVIYRQLYKILTKTQSYDKQLHIAYFYVQVRLLNLTRDLSTQVPFLSFLIFFTETAVFRICPIFPDLSQKFLHHLAGGGILICTFEKHLPETALKWALPFPGNNHEGITHDSPGPDPASV